MCSNIRKSTENTYYNINESTNHDASYNIAEKMYLQLLSSLIDFKKKKKTT